MESIDSEKKEQQQEEVRICHHCKNETILRSYGKYIYQNEYEHDSPLGYEFVRENVGYTLFICSTCRKPTLEGYEDSGYGSEYYILYPNMSEKLQPSKYLPKEVHDIYNEARDVLPHSPRASAAFLRLAIQKLCIHLGQEGKNLNKDIETLIKEKNLSPIAQKALHSVRVIGNHAVHPGQIDIEDDKILAEKLFELVNFIVHETITRPRMIEEIYNNLPENKKSVK